MSRGGKGMDELAHICAWCNKRIPEDAEVFGLPAKARQGIDLKGQEGTIIQLSLALVDKTVPAIVVASDSEAKRQGYDFAFMLCSQACARSLKDALQREIDIVAEVGTVH
jgi:hypothetical protein